MTFKELVLKLTELEGKKKQVSVAQITEVVSQLKKLVKKDPSVLIALLKK